LIELVKKFKLQVGDRFIEIESNLSRRIEKIETSLVKHESFWVEQLATINPITVPGSPVDVVMIGLKQQVLSCNDG